MTLPFNPSPRLLAVIADRDNAKRLEDIMREKHTHFQYMLHGMGTANSEILKAFGLSGSEKIICLAIAPGIKARTLMRTIAERLEVSHPGNGITFVIPISGVSAAISGAFAKEFEEHSERWQEVMELEADKTHAEARHELVVTIVNQGYSQDVMDAARALGVRGGTIVNARRTGLEDASKFFGISLQAEKELVAIIIGKAEKKALMQAITAACGIKTEARGIVISLPVESCAGLGEE